MTSQREEDDLQTCADCGLATDASRDRGYAAGEWVLCFSCAMKRNGTYDSTEDRWSVPPRTDDLWGDDDRR